MRVSLHWSITILNIIYKKAKVKKNKKRNLAGRVQAKEDLEEEAKYEVEDISTRAHL